MRDREMNIKTKIAIISLALSFLFSCSGNLFKTLLKPAGVIRLEVTPVTASIAAGTTRQLSVTIIYPDSSKKDVTASADWETSDTTTATVSASGNALGLRPGTVTITATAEGVSAEMTLVITDAELVSIAVTPINPSTAKGFTRQFTATGTFSDNTTQDLTSSATWSSSDISVASISNTSGFNGLSAALNTGITTIAASQGTVSGSTLFTVTSATLQSISVTPSGSSKPKGLTAQFTATGTFSDSTTQNITAQVSWSSSADAIASISNNSGSQGLCSTHVAGSVTISASLDGVSGTAGFTVTPAELVSLEVNPVNPSRAMGSTVQFTATGIYTDSTHQDLTAAVTWSTSSGLIATVSNASGNQGQGTAVDTGVAVITATDPVSGTISASTDFTVTAATLVSIAVTPMNKSKAKGLYQQFNATGTYSDLSTQDITASVTWSTSNSGISSISNVAGNQGNAFGESPGTVTVTATDPVSGTISGSTNFTVTAATLVSISVDPTNPSTAKGLTQQFTATGTFTDSSTQNITEQVTWSSGDTNIATVNNTAGTKGVGTAVNTGTAVITATDPVSGTISGSTNFSVSGADPGIHIGGPDEPVQGQGTHAAVHRHGDLH